MIHQGKRHDSGNPLFGLLFFVALIGAGVAALVLLEPARPGQPDPAIAPVGRKDFVAHPRVVTLAPHLAELVYAAGAGNHLQAVTRYSDFPPPVKELPQVGDAFALDYEKLLRLKPELVLAWADGTPLPVQRKLGQIGLTVEPIRIQRLADIGAAIRRIGTVLGTATEARQQAGFFEQELRQRQQVAGSLPKQRVFIQTSDKPLYTVSGQHWISEAVGLCGLQNVFADLPLASAPVNAEAVVSRQPEVIVMLSAESQAFQGGQNAIRVAPEKTLWGQWPQLSAVASGRIIRVNPDVLSRPGPRVLTGVAALCEQLQAR